MSANAVLFDWTGRPLSSEDFQPPSGFGPVRPLPPQFPDVEAPPWEYQYPAGFNVIPQPRTESGRWATFAQLRQWATLCPQARVCFEYVKRELRGKPWSIVPVEDEKLKSAHDKHKDEIDRVTAFMRKPYNIGEGLSFSSWLGQIWNELLEIDTAVLYIQRTRGGELHSFTQINGETIKPLIDAWGHVVGYQQILYGRPTTEYPTGETVVGEYSSADLRYIVYNPRVDSVYGTPGVEEMLSIVMTAINRAQRHNDWYSLGTVPESFLVAPKEWTVDQIKAYQTWVDKRFAPITFNGVVVDGSKRARMHMLPGGEYVPAKPFAFSKDEDEAIWNFVSAYYGIPRARLMSQTNKSTAAAGKDDSVDAGLKPRLIFMEEVLSDLIAGPLEAPELKFKWVDDVAGESLERAQRNVAYVTAGILTEDEVRSGELGLDPLPEEAKVEPVPPLAPGQPPTPGQPSPAPAQGAAAKVPNSGAAVPNGSAAKPADAKAELDRWRRFALKRLGKTSRPFVAKSIPTNDAARISMELAKAKTRDDILAAFEKARPRKRLSDAAKGKARRKLAQATSDYLNAIKDRVLSRFGKTAGAQLTKSDDWADLSHSYRVNITPTISNVWSLGAQDAADQVGGGSLDFDYFDKHAADYAATRSTELIDGMDETTRGRVSEIIARQVAAGEDAADALEEAGIFDDARAELVARTEVAIAQNKGATATYKQLGITHVHVFDGDSDEECAAANGELWTVEEAEESPIEHPNCERAFSPASTDESDESEE